MHLKEHPFQPVKFYSTAQYPCSYLPNKLARSQVATPSHLIHSDVYGGLLVQGFRRSGLFTYRPHCDGCHACVPLRVPVSDFSPSRSQMRAWKKHQNLVCEVVTPAFKPEHYALYLRYQAHRHSGGGMDDDSVDQYTQYLLQTRVNTRLVEFREIGAGQTLSEVKMVCLIDIVSDGISAVYTFFDPHATASYGTYAVLWMIEQARQCHLPHVYLGYWIRESPKMAYKTAFRPHELLIDGIWQRA